MSDFETIINRLARLRADTSPQSAKVKQALTRIGTVLRSEMVKTAPIKHGRLRSSINYILRQTSTYAEVEVGSYGVPYAAIVEFGFNGIQQVRAHERRVKGSTRLAQVSAHSRRVDRKAKPYIRPSLRKHSQFIVDMIRTIAEPS